MNTTTHWFVKDDGRRLPVNEDYLFRALSPTTPGTKYWEGPPPAPLSERNKGRILLQIHQFLSLFRTYGIDLAGKSLVDIGTGNGLVPSVLLALTELKSAIGADPYLDGDHKTSWHAHDHNKAYKDIASFLAAHCKDQIDVRSYQHFLKHENYSMLPSPVPYSPQSPKNYRFAQVGAHDIDTLGETFDIVYCKAIEHIPNWKLSFEKIAAVTKPGSIVYFKHRSFFSFLGPHRYASTAIPWGHLLLTDDEFRRYAAEFHSERAADMIDFYFNGLAYPRHPVSEMLRIAASVNIVPVSVIYEPPRYLDKIYNLTWDVDGFWDILRENWPNLPTEELMSGMVHILLRRI